MAHKQLERSEERALMIQHEHNAVALPPDVRAELTERLIAS
jgi:hypothetical protein